MTKSLVILGNGFDMTIGLKSSLKQFINTRYHHLNTLLKPLKKYFNSPIFKSTLYKYKGNNFTPSLLLRYMNGFRILKDAYSSTTNIDIKSESNTCNNYISNIFNNDNNINFWSLYCLLKESRKITNWSDVESNIYSFIMKPYNSLIIKGLYYKTHNEDDFQYHLYNEIGSGSNSTLIYFLIYILYMNPYNQLPDLSNYSYKQIDYTALSFLNNEVNDFEHNLNNYLIYTIKDYNKNNHNKLSYYDMSKLVLSYITNNKSFSLLNFNYTNPTKEMKTINDRILNIHGKLQSKITNTNNLIIIGTSDKNISSSNTHKFVFTKLYKRQCHEFSMYLHDIFTSDINKIIFFGHSLDLADVTYFYRIFKRYNILDPKTHMKLIFYYVPYKNKARESQIKNIDSLFSELYRIDMQNNGNAQENINNTADIKAKNLIGNLRDNRQLIICNAYTDKVYKLPNNTLKILKQSKSNQNN